MKNFRVNLSSSVRFVLGALAAILLTAHGVGRVELHATSNIIAVENDRAGDTDWGITGAGDPTIQGFATNISVNTGETVEFKIATDSANYRIDIYRLGYYRDAGARKVATSDPNAPTVLARPVFATALPQSQPACQTDLAIGLVDCATWGVSATWSSTDAVSGIYIAKLNRIDTGGSSHIVFVVRDDSRRADIIAQTSDTTWQAYNQYGGYSLYCAPNGVGLSNAGTAYASCPNRAAKVSYNRPITTRDQNARSFLFNGDYPMVKWMEANGYDVKYWAGVDTDRHGADLVIPTLKPNVFVSMGHDEYWSGDQRTRVEAARNAGVNLAFFSGNEMYWKTRYESDYRTLVTYKETLAAAKIDTAPEWTGTWRDPRFSPPSDGGRPENALTGNIWTVNSGTAAIQVPASMAGLRIWQHTRIADLQPGDPAVTLAPESLGYEWDEDLDNGARPAGLMHLSDTTVNGVEKIIDYGATVGIGTATHHLTLYRHSNASPATTALVFGAGTVQWSWGLDGTHDGDSHTPDQAMQQATITLLADMGAQPLTLQAGPDPLRPLVAVDASADTIPPTSHITSPTGGVVTSGNHVTITGDASDAGGGAAAAVEVSVDGGVTWRAAEGVSTWSFDWVPNATGAVTIRSRAIDDSGNFETPGPSVIVSVAPGNCPCATLWQPSTVPNLPSNGDGNAVELGVKFKSDINGFISGIRYYKGTLNQGSHIGNLWTEDGTLLASATFIGETTSGWQQMNFSQPVAITANTVYVASYHTNSGHYASDGAYFANVGTDSPPLHALSNTAAGGNGVYRYGSTAFPSSTFNATNYYVDVLFAETVIDSSELEITNISSSAIDGSTAIVSWTTSRAATSSVDYSTDQSFPAPPLTSTVDDGAFVTQHHVTLSGLTPNSTYYFMVSSADHDGTLAVAVAPSFTVPGPTLHDTARLDFEAGTVNNTYVAQTADGEVILAPTTGSEFTGPMLPDGWVEVTWSSSGYLSIANGVLIVQGARVAACEANIPGACSTAETTTATAPENLRGGPRSLEFSARFSVAGDTFQHAGFGQTFASEAEPWAMFSTGSDGQQLYVRSNPGGGSTNTGIGAQWLGSFHRFRIDWKADSVDYYIDGALVASHAVTIVAPMRAVAASDFDPNGGVVFVDWMRMSSYAGTGTFESRIFDALSSVPWRTIQWTKATPDGTSVEISVRTGDTPVPDGSWSSFTPIAGPGALNVTSRYIQYRATLTTSHPEQTPELQDIILSTSLAPVPQNKNIAINQDVAYTFPASGPGSLLEGATDDTPFEQLRFVGVSAALHGTVIVNTNGSVTYTPAAGFNGDDTFTYTISDGLLTGTATVHMEVGQTTATNNDPIAVDDAATVAEDSHDNPINVLGNDSVGPDTGETLSITSVTQGAHGSVSFTATGVSYTPATDYNGSDVFTYTIGDGNGGSATATVSVTVTGVNDDPVANPDTATVAEDTGATAIDVLANDNSGPDTGETLSVTAVTQGVHGAVTFTATGVSYTPAADYNGPDSFTYTIGDGNGGSATATVSVTVTGANDAPAADAQSVTTAEDTAASITLTGSDVDGDTLTFAIASGPSHGSLTGTGASRTYTPAADYNGSDSFTFTVSDGTATSAAATVSITVTAVNDAPAADAQSVTTAEDTAASITLTGSDLDGDTLTFAIASGPSHGTLTGTGANRTYTPAANYNGSDSFTFTVSDGTVTSAAATVSITVTAVNDAPAADAQSVTTAEDAAAGITLTGSDVDGDTLTFAIASGPSHGTLTGSGASRTYTPAANYNGADSFTFTVSDGTVTSAAATVSITITAVNDVPSFTKGADQTVAQNAPAQTVSGWATALSAGGGTDENGQTLDFLVTNSNNALFSAQPSVSATGTLTYTPATGATGSATVTVRIHDNGGVVNGGVDTSAPQTFTITVTGPSTLTINDVAVVEGNSGNTPAVFTVTLNPAASSTVTVAYQTLGGTATSPKDFTPVSGTLTFTPGQVTQTVTVLVKGETTKESNESYVVRLSSATNAVIGDNEGLGTIIDDDNTPQFSVMSTSTSSTTEGNTGKKMMTFAVVPTNGNSEPMSVEYLTVAGQGAREGVDYEPASGVLVFPAETTDPQFITVPVIGNLRHQINRNVFIHLQNAIQAVLDGIDGQGAIVDDDPTPAMSISDVSVGESNSGMVNAVFAVTMTNDTDDVVTVNWATADGSALGGFDYQAGGGMLKFLPGETTQVITIPVYAATWAEGTETFYVNLSGLTNATMAKSTGTVTITAPPTWVTSTTTEFGLGTVGAGAYVSETSGGEVTLAPTVGTEFSGTALPAGWTNGVLALGGVTTVANGSIVADGASALAPVTYTAGHTLEFSATFTGQPGQNVGFGLTSALLPPYAMFGVKADGLLYARSVAPGTAFETAIAPLAGGWFTGPHRFRIDWNATTVVYWIDGAQRVTHTITYKGAGAAMKPAITDQTVGGGGVSVDWMRMSAYSASGVYTSPVYDAGSVVAWQRATWVADVTPGTTVLVQVRTGNTATPDASWTAYTTVATSGGALTSSGQYAQYKLTLSTTVANATPAVKEVALDFVR